jgi:integrase/recombinase XerC
MPNLSVTELTAILGAVRERSRKKMRDKAIIAFMLDTGARASEVCDLDVGHGRFEQGSVHLFGKGRKGRVGTRQCHDESRPADVRPRATRIKRPPTVPQ